MVMTPVCMVTIKNCLDNFYSFTVKYLDQLAHIRIYYPMIHDFHILYLCTNKNCLLFGEGTWYIALKH